MPNQLKRGRLVLTLAATLAAFTLILLQGCAPKAVDNKDTGTTIAAQRPLPVPRALPGLQESEGPWLPEYSALGDRLTRLGFPPPGDESYHIHALLHIFVEGKALPVPTNIGISVRDQILSPLHTHDGSGVIHVEAAFEFPFRLADVFAVWGVVFSESQLGSHRNSGDKTVQVYVNGEQVKDPETYVLKNKDNVVVAYGAPGSFDKEPPADALQGLP